MPPVNPTIIITGGIDLYVRQFGLSNHDEFYTNTTLLTAFQNYTSQVVTRYVDSPAVFAWYESSLHTGNILSLLGKLRTIRGKGLLPYRVPRLTRFVSDAILQLGQAQFAIQRPLLAG